VNGGAIALGHPLAASGSRIITHLVHELRYSSHKYFFFLYIFLLIPSISIHIFVCHRRRKTGKFGIGSACIGGGQGIAMMIEAL